MTVSSVRVAGIRAYALLLSDPGVSEDHGPQAVDVLADVLDDEGTVSL